MEVKITIDCQIIEDFTYFCIENYNSILIMKAPITYFFLLVFFFVQIVKGEDGTLWQLHASDINIPESTNIKKGVPLYSNLC